MHLVGFTVEIVSDDVYIEHLEDWLRNSELEGIWEE